ncbi:MAG: YraN family protein [Myxococcales bacterium]|nr:YraN family protein [Myxococcales bacterium]
MEAYLRERGFEVLARNARMGRLELDLVARKGALLVVCEVRSRRTDRWVSPAATVDGAKIERVRRAALAWIRAHRPGTSRLRFDVASVIFDGETPPRVQYYERAF